MSKHAVHLGHKGRVQSLVKLAPTGLPLEQDDMGAIAYRGGQGTQMESDQERIRQLEQQNASQMVMLDNRELYEISRGRGLR